MTPVAEANGVFTKLHEKLQVMDDTFSIELNEIGHKKSKLIRLWIVGAIILIITMALSFYLIGNDATRMAVLVPIVLEVAIYFYFAYSTYNAHVYIQSDSYAIEYKFGMLSKIPKSIIWETITKVKIGPTYIAFYKKSGKRTTLNLGWLPYVKLKEIKEKICAATHDKGIRCEWSEYKKYS